MNINRLANKFEQMKAETVKHSELQLTDNTELIIDGCKKVIEYDDNFIRLLLADREISIVGVSLKMRNFSNFGVVVNGKINSLTFI